MYSWNIMVQLDIMSVQLWCSYCAACCKLMTVLLFWQFHHWFYQKIYIWPGMCVGTCFKICDVCIFGQIDCIMSSRLETEESCVAPCIMFRVNMTDVTSKISKSKSKSNSEVRSRKTRPGSSSVFNLQPFQSMSTMMSLVDCLWPPSVISLMVLPQYVG